MGQKVVADRLLYLEELPIEDKYDSTSLESLRGFASFVLSKPTFLSPRIGTGPDGLISAEWDKDNDSLAVEFINYDEVRFVALFHSSDPKHVTSGRLTLQKMLIVNKSLLEYFL